MPNSFKELSFFLDTEIERLDKFIKQNVHKTYSDQYSISNARSRLIAFLEVKEFLSNEKFISNENVSKRRKDISS